MTSKHNPLSLDRQICFALYRASRAIIRAYTPMLDALGLTYPQYLVLLVLWEKDQVPVGFIGEKLELDSATLTPLLKRMEQAGLIDRSRSPEDERVVMIALTRKGRSLRSSALDIPKKLAEGAGFDLRTEKAREDLAKCLQMLAKF